jgi:hypothetical protein
MTYDHIQNIFQIISYCAVFYLVSQIKNPTFATYLFVIPISFISTYLYLTFPEDIDPIYGFNDSAENVLNLSIGYFLYENIINFSTKSTTSGKIHGIILLPACLIMYYAQIAIKYTIGFLPFEISTIFMDSALKSDNPIYKILFVSTFFIFRIIWGTIISYDLITSSYNEISCCLSIKDDSIKYISLNMIIGLCVAFMGLNYFWFYKIMKKVQKLMVKQSDKSE